MALIDLLKKYQSQSGGVGILDAGKNSRTQLSTAFNFWSFITCQHYSKRPIGSSPIRI